MIGSLKSAAAFSLPLPLAGEVAALEERGGWGKSLRGLWRSEYAAAPPPQPSPRKRERERSGASCGLRPSELNASKR
jgi:hypothetical protein